MNHLDDVLYFSAATGAVALIGSLLVSVTQAVIERVTLGRASFDACADAAVRLGNER